MRVRLAVCGAVAVAALLAPAPTSAQDPDEAVRELPSRVLVFSRTTAFRHISIPFGHQAIKEIGGQNGFGVESSEDPAAFRDANLARFGAVVFLSTTGSVMDDEGRAAFERFVQGGGGYVGIHSAADTEYSWPFYERTVGTYFKNHPLQQTAAFINEARGHPATRHLPERFTTFDEFYSFRYSPRSKARVLLRIDESTYGPDPNTSNLPGGTPATGVMGDHPMAWCHDVGRGRSFYTALGHEPYLYSLGWYRRHILGGIRTALRRVEADCSAPPDAPKLRLVRRCIARGALELRLRGETAQVGSVAFKLGRRTMSRDAQAPFEGRVEQAALRRTRATRLRAVARPSDGQPQTVVLERSLPRCR